MQTSQNYIENPIELLKNALMNNTLEICGYNLNAYNSPLSETFYHKIEASPSVVTC
jgi:hypothetical protein